MCTFQKLPGYKFTMNAKAKDMGKSPLSSTIDIEIIVVEPHKKAPSFYELPTAPIPVPENFSDYEATIASVRALSNIEENPDYFLYELVTGRTDQTNKQNNFRYL